MSRLFMESEPSEPLRLRARPDVVAVRRPGRRAAWFLKDPVSLNYFFLEEQEFAIWQMLDGRTTSEQIRRRFESRFPPLSLSWNHLRGLLASFYSSGLILSDSPGQAQIMRREKRRSLLGWLLSLGGLLSFRAFSVDPQNFLDGLYPRVRWLFSPLMLIVYGILVTLAGGLITTRAAEIAARLPSVQSFLAIENVALLTAAMLGLKVCHELGHALVCRHFGGECHELGILMIVFAPFLYCDVSDAWSLPSRWQRIAISAAGMGVEIVLAALCAWLWWFSVPGVLNSLCLNLMVVGSLSTLLFNANPLMKYDGYYILADLLDVPNLSQEAGAVLRSRVAHWTLGWPITDSPGARHIPTSGLLAFGIGSLVWRVLLIPAILWVCYAFFEPLGLRFVAHIIAASVVAGVVLPPLVRLKSWQRSVDSPPINRVRLSLTLLGLLVALGVSCGVKLPMTVTAALIVEPRDARSVYVTVPGHLRTAVVPQTVVKADEVLVELVNDDLAAQLKRLENEQQVLELRVKNLDSLRVTDTAAGNELPTTREMLADVERRVTQLRSDLARLKIVAPVSGTVLPPPPTFAPQQSRLQLGVWQDSPLSAANRGAFLVAGTLVCVIGEPERVECVLTIDQSDIEFVQVGQSVDLQLAQRPGDVFEGRVEEISQIDPLRGEGLTTDGRPENSTRGGFERTTYRARVSIQSPLPSVAIRGTGQARIHVAPQSLIDRAYRALRSTFRWQ